MSRQAQQRQQALHPLPEKVSLLTANGFALLTSGGCEVVRIIGGWRRLATRPLTQEEELQYINGNAMFDVHSDDGVLMKEMWIHDFFVQYGGNGERSIVLASNLVALPNFKLVKRHKLYTCDSCNKPTPGHDFVWGYNLRLPLDVQVRDRKLHCATCAASIFTGQAVGHAATTLALAVLRGDDSAANPLADELIELGEDTKSSALQALYSQALVQDYHTYRERIPKMWSSQRCYF